MCKDTVFLCKIEDVFQYLSNIACTIRINGPGFADIHQATLNLIANPAFNLSTVSIDTAGYIYAHASVWTGTFVGRKYMVDCKGICYTLSQNNFFPGTVAGEVSMFER